MGVAEVLEAVRRDTPSRRLTISGGEPMHQAEAVTALLAKLPDFDRALYTSREVHEVPAELLRNLEHLKSGPYVHALRTTTIPFVGSSNQRFSSFRNREDRRD